MRYLVAASLDGYIAGPNGEIDWITTDPEIDFAAISNQFDTILLGRRTFELVLSSGRGLFPGKVTYVFSRTLNRPDHPNVSLVAEKPEEVVSGLRATPGKDIWLFGGGVLFRSLAAAKLVDSVEVSVMPVLLGGGTSLLPIPAQRIQLTLTTHKIYKSGIVRLEYAVR